MTAIASTTATPSNFSSTSTPATADAGFGDVTSGQFLKLLVAQLQNQNPLDPQDGSAFVAQLAQFSQLDAATKTNQELTTINSGQSALANAALSNIVGKTVTAKIGSITVDGTGAATSLSAHFDSAAASASVVITDASGKAVRTITLGAEPAGTVPLSWSGTADDGSKLPAGAYSIAVTATASDGTAVNGYGTITAPATALRLDQNGTSFDVGGSSVIPASIISIAN